MHGAIKSVTVNPNFFEEYNNAVSSGDIKGVQNLFDDGNTVKDGAKQDSVENKDDIKSIKKGINKSKGTKKASAGVQKEAQKIDKKGTYLGYPAAIASRKGNKLEVYLRIGESWVKSTVEFGADGSKIVNINNKDTKTKTTMVYDEKGTLRQETVKNNKTKETTVTQYDETGKPNKKVTTKQNDPIYRDTTYYDNEGKAGYRTVRTKNSTTNYSFEYNKDGTLAGSYGITKDENGKVTARVAEKINGNVKYVTTEGKDGALETQAMYRKLSDGSWGIMNGDLDETFMQGSIGDCWFLSALNGLNQTEIGKSIIRDAIKANDDGSVSVTFKGAGKTYTVTPDEIAKASKTFSTGDMDAMVLEIAGNKLRADIQSGKVKLPDEIDSSAPDKGKKAIEGGFQRDALYFFTGKMPNQNNEPNEVIMDAYLGLMAEGSCEMVLGFALYIGDYYAKGVNGSPDFDLKLGENHALTVISATEDTVTIANPWNSDKHYTISIEDFKNFGLKSMTFLPLE